MAEMRTYLTQVTDRLYLDSRARGEWCRLPYIDHPKGCPNWGNKLTCPPQAEPIEYWFDMNKRFWLVSVQFDLGDFAREMQHRHQEWTDRQARNVLLWQSSVNARLREEAKQFIWQRPGTIYTLCPEGRGLNVIKTAKRAAIPITTHPKETVFKIALIGYPRTAGGNP